MISRRAFRKKLLQNFQKELRGGTLGDYPAEIPLRMFQDDHEENPADALGEIHEELHNKFCKNLK